MWKRSQTTKRSQTAPVQSEERSDDEDGEIELPHELVGQYVDLGQRRAAVWEMLLEMLSQHSGLGSAADLDIDTREDLEEDLEEMIAEAHED